MRQYKIDKEEYKRIVLLCGYVSWDDYDSKYLLGAYDYSQYEDHVGMTTNDSQFFEFIRELHHSETAIRNYHLLQEAIDL